MAIRDMYNAISIFCLDITVRVLYYRIGNVTCSFAVVLDGFKGDSLNDGTVFESDLEELHCLIGSECRWQLRR